MCNVAYSISPSTGTYTVTTALTWNANGSLQEMKYTDGSPSPMSQDCKYSADDLSRIASVDCGSSAWGQNFSYDPFGNIQKAVIPGRTGTTYSTTGYSTVTNQVLSSSVATYDKNGNQLTSTPATLTWNAWNVPITVNGTSATYDALGRMVEKGSGSTYTQFVFRPSGDNLAVYSGGLTKGTVALPGGATAVYNASGLSFIRHLDWLGSSRLATTWAHAVYSKEAYAPFGETYNESGTADRSFTGQDQNVVTGSGGSGAYDFLFRKYDPSAGRWLSPDPLGWGSVDPADPRSLDRYAYVENQPLNAVDMAGLDVCVSAGGVPYDSGAGNGCPGGYTDLGPSPTPIITQTVWAPFNQCYSDDSDSGACLFVNTMNSFATGNFTYLSFVYAPNPQQPSVAHCVASAVKKEGVSLLIDTAGAIPGEGQALAVTQLVASGAGYVNGLMQNDPQGAVGSVLGGQATLVGMAGKGLGVTAFKVIPGLGNVLSGYFALRDYKNMVEDYLDCRDGGS